MLDVDAFPVINACSYTVARRGVMPACNAASMISLHPYEPSY